MSWKSQVLVGQLWELSSDSLRVFHRDILYMWASVWFLKTKLLLLLIIFRMTFLFLFEIRSRFNVWYKNQKGDFIKKLSTSNPHVGYLVFIQIALTRVFTDHFLGCTKRLWLGSEELDSLLDFPWSSEVRYPQHADGAGWARSCGHIAYLVLYVFFLMFLFRELA